MKKIALGKKKAGLLVAAIVLITTNIAFAVLYMTKPVTITGGVKSVGAIEIYNQAGTEIINTFAFEQFDPGVSDTNNMFFNIKNTGNVPVYVYWEITSPTATWTATGNQYRCDEQGVPKYYMFINKQYDPYGTWAPNPSSVPVADKRILINSGQSASLAMQLDYTGNVNTPEALSVTVSFTAQSS